MGESTETGSYYISEEVEVDSTTGEVNERFLPDTWESVEFRIVARYLQVEKTTQFKPRYDVRQIFNFLAKICNRQAAGTRIRNMKFWLDRR